MGQATEKRITRLAPSPTGALHLGNLRTFVINWVLARQRGWQIVFRVDDLDSPRVKAGAAADSLEILRWIGLDWDGDPVFESQLRTRYHETLVELAARGAIYPCRCTRLQIQQQAASAPHGDQHELRYSGTCTPPQGTSFTFDATEHDGAAWRFRVPAQAVKVQDQFCGAHSFDVQQLVGDFLVANRQRQPVYQLAVVIDDHFQQVTDIVRGDDLLTSTPRQILLQQCLGLPSCRYWHLPLVVGADGHRLAKRHGDTRIAWYRDQGVRAERLLGLMAQWSGWADCQECTLADFLQHFHIQSLPTEPRVFTARDHAWLLADSTR